MASGEPSQGGQGAETRAVSADAEFGEPVYVPLPETAADALRKISNGEHFFWTGKGLRKSVADWQRSLRRVSQMPKWPAPPTCFDTPSPRTFSPAACL